jgi:hypothetical protein
VIIPNRKSVREPVSIPTPEQTEYPSKILEVTRQRNFIAARRHVWIGNDGTAAIVEWINQRGSQGKISTENDGIKA